jgi:dihydrofolate reductase
MGRKTFESIIARNGRPLPDRLNIVLSHSRNFPEFPGVATARSLDDALRAAREHSPAFVIGGETIYAAALPQADRLELTLVDGDYLGDAFFPEFEHLLETEFEETAFEKGEGYRFVTYERL